LTFPDYYNVIVFNCQDANCLIGNYDDANKALGGICEECKVGF